MKRKCMKKLSCYFYGISFDFNDGDDDDDDNDICI